MIACLALLLWLWNIHLRHVVKRRTRELTKRDAIQRAVGFAAERFSDASFIEKADFQDILEQFGKATDASRVYLFENSVSKAGELVASQRSEWVGKGITPQTGNPELQNFSYKDEGFERWIEVFNRGQIIEGNVRDFPRSEQDILSPQDILSILVVPVLVNGRWWGFLGFDECRFERNWSVAEIGVLKAAGRILGGLIQWKRAEDKLKRSHERFRTVLNSLDSAVYVADMETYELLFINQRIRDLFGNVEGQLCWKSIHNDQSGPCDFCTNERLIDESGQPKEPYVWEIQNSKAGGWWEVRDQAIQWIDGRIVRLEVASDISDRKQAEERIAASLKEKEVLLREIHHRVKNNMQVIVSMLRMHSRRIDDTRLRQVFDECRDRVNAMSLIHESLYQSDDLARIDFKVYLKKLCRNLSQAHGASGKGIEVFVDRCNVALDMDQGIAVGMVISELITNAFKHAFPLGKGGRVSVRLSGLEGEEVELIVQDDGKGLPPEIDILNPVSLGLQLTVAAVTRELDGSIEVERDGGTRFIIRFKGKN